MLGPEHLNVWFWGLKITEALARHISYITHVLWKVRLLGKWKRRFRLHREIDEAGEKGEKRMSKEEKNRQEREEDKREESRRDTEEQAGRDEGERNCRGRSKRN
jgi:hypothetical protein